jgi:hypothetical protein
MSKAHMQVNTNKESREKQAWSKPGPNRAKTGPDRPAWANQPSPFRARFDAPFDLAASRAIYSPPGRDSRGYTFVIRRQGVEKRGTPFRRGEGRDG